MFCTILFTIHTHVLRPFSRTTRVSWYQRGKTNLDFTEARDSEWQWHQLGHMQACTSLQTDNHASTPPLSFLHAGCPSCRPTNSVKALKEYIIYNMHSRYVYGLHTSFFTLFHCRSSKTVIPANTLRVGLTFAGDRFGPNLRNTK